MNYREWQIISPDNKRALRFRHQARESTIEVIDLKTQQVLHTRKDHGDHTSATFTEDENIIIYITHDNNWRWGPIINMWDLEDDTHEEFVTDHHPQSSVIMEITPKSQRLVLGTIDGSISAYNMQTLKVLWHHEKSEDGKHNSILSLAISECGEKVATLQKDILSVYDFATGNKLLSSPFMEEYISCEFGENDSFIRVIHPEKAAVKISCQAIAN